MRLWFEIQLGPFLFFAGMGTNILIDLCTKQMHTDMKKLAVFLIVMFLGVNLSPAATDSNARVVVFEMNEEVSPSLWVKTQKAFELANRDSADMMLLHINTYGGTVADADSIRTRILNSTIPVVAFIENQAKVATEKVAMIKAMFKEKMTSILFKWDDTFLLSFMDVAS